jgi:hypothetical protein
MNKEVAMSVKPGSGKIARSVRHVVEPLERRELLSTTVTGVPNWAELGPGPMTGGAVRGIPNQPVTGAVSAIVINPNDANTIPDRHAQRRDLQDDQWGSDVDAQDRPA